MSDMLKCGNCVHKYVCKWSDSMKKLNERAEKIKTDKDDTCPLKIDIQCSFYAYKD